MGRSASPSTSGTDPLTGRAIRLKATAKTEQHARIELGRLLKDASEGRTPESAATVVTLLEEYVLVAPWDVSARQTNEGFIRRTIKPALGHIEVRKVRGPILDQLYARLKRCGDLSCTGRPFIEHCNIPALVIKARDRRPASQQVADMLAEAIQSGRLAPGDELLDTGASPALREEYTRRTAAAAAWTTTASRYKGTRSWEFC